MRIRTMGVIGLLAGLTIASGLMHGRMANRWGVSADMMQLAVKLEDIPHQFGNWQLQSSHEIDANALNMLECVGYIYRTYINRETRHTVRISIVLGPTGPIAVHTPEICFGSQGHNITKGPNKVSIRDSEGADQEFQTITLESNSVDRNAFSVFFAWNRGDAWVAPENPRLTLSTQKHLFKLQLAGPVEVSSVNDSGDVCRTFLRDFVPVANSYLTLSES